MIGQFELINEVNSNQCRNEATHKGKPDDVLPMPVEVEKVDANEKDAKK